MSHINNTNNLFFKIGLVLAVVFSTAIYAQEYKVYTLYNGEFEAAFANQPSSLYQGGAISYTSGDKVKQISLTATKFPSPLGKNIGGYNKKALDQGMLDSFKPIATMINFESAMDKQNGLYIFIVAYSQYDNDLKMTLYTFEKRIITNESMYSWRVTSPTMANKKAFDQYKDSCRIRH